MPEMNLVDLYLAAAKTTDRSPTPWWSDASGILAIPAAILTLVISVQIIKKSKLETQKLSLEIAEKQALNQNRETSSSEEVSGKVSLGPFFEGRIVQEIILRFILLFLILQAWKIVEVLFEVMIRSAIVPILPSGYGMPGYLYTIIYLLFISFKALPTVGYYLLAVSLGGPMLLQIMRYLHIDYSPKISFLEAPGRWTYISVTVVVVVMYAGDFLTGSDYF